jgi:hypothetical protein
LENLGIDSVILRWRLKKLGEWEWTGFMWPQMGTSGRLIGHGIEHLGFTKCGELVV